MNRMMLGIFCMLTVQQICAVKLMQIPVWCFSDEKIAETVRYNFEPVHQELEKLERDKEVVRACWNKLLAYMKLEQPIFAQHALTMVSAGRELYMLKEVLKKNKDSMDVFEGYKQKSIQHVIENKNTLFERANKIIAEVNQKDLSDCEVHLEFANLSFEHASKDWLKFRDGSDEDRCKLFAYHTVLGAVLGLSCLNAGVKEPSIEERYECLKKQEISQASKRLNIPNDPDLFAFLEVKVPAERS